MSQRHVDLPGGVTDFVLRRKHYYYNGPRDALNFLTVGEWGLAIDLAAWVDANDENPITISEAEEMVFLHRACEQEGEAGADDATPWILLNVVDGEGRTVRWTPPLRPDRTEPPKRGGGHLAGKGRRGRAEFPPVWKRHDVIRQLQDVAAHPVDGQVVPLPGDLFRAWDVREGVLCEVIVDRAGALLTGYPVSGPHVHHNQGRDDVPVTDLGLDRSESHLVNELGAVVDELTLGLSPWTADSVRSLHRAGEWQLCVRVLTAALAEHGGSIDPARRDQLARLARETGATAVAE